KPNFDAFRASPTKRTLSPTESDALQKAALFGSKIHIDEKLGIPRFLWAADKGPASQQGIGKGGKRNEEIAARGHLARLATLYRLSPAEINSAKLSSIHNKGK